MNIAQPQSLRSKLLRWYRPHSLRWRLFNILSLIFLVTLVIIGASTYYFIHQNEQRTWQERQTEAANSASEIISTVRERAEDTLRLAGSLHRHDLIENPQIMPGLLKQNPSLLELVRLDKAGSRLPGAYQDTQLLVNSLTISQTDWFIQAKAGQVYLGNVQISPEGKPYLVMAVPTPDGGVVAARLRMDMLWDAVDDLHFGKTGQSYVVNTQGEIMAHTDPAIALSHTNLAGRLEMAALLQAPNHEWGGAYENFEGVQVVGVTAPIEGTEWVVITEVATTETFAISRTALLLLVAGLSLVGLLVTLVAGRFLNNLILRPMEQLEAGAIRIGQGALSYQLDLGRWQYDEVSRVARAFNDMASHLRDRDARIAKQTQTLKEREERFRQVVSSVSDHIYMSEITQDGSYINRYVAPNIQALTGYPREKFMADWRFWPSQVIHPDDQAAAAAQAARFAQGDNSEMEYRLVRADGTIIWVRDSGQVRKNPDGQSVFVFGVVSDITERKQAEKIKEQQQAFLQQVIDINPHFVFAKDRQGRFTLVNQAFARIYGISVPEVIGKTDVDLNPDKAMAARYQHDDQTVIGSGQDLVIPEDMVINSKGQKMWRHTIKRPIMNEAGQVSQVLGIAIDITQRKQVEEDLRFQKTLLEAQGEVSLDGILVVSDERTFLYFNQRFVEMWDIPKQVIESRSSQAALEAVLKKVADPATFMARVNYLYEHKDEESREEIALIDGRTLDRYSAPVKSPEGLHYGRVWYFRDITERKRVEEAIAHARDQALEASQLKSELLARVSHELRTPLNAILGYTEILHEGFYGSLSNSQAEVIQKIILSTTHLTGLVNEILDQARLEANSLKLEKREFDPVELIDRIEPAMVMLAQNKGLQLAIEIDPDLPPVLLGDPERITQILNNLTNNALKFTERGAVKVRIYRSDREYWAIEVTDTGPGIPEKAKAYIFDAFRQVDGSITRKHGGSGLGLSIVKKLVTLMGGEITLESTEGQGSTFRVLLPLVQSWEAVA